MKRILVIGDGGIGMGFAHYCQAHGKDVVLLGRGHTIGNLPKDLTLDLDNVNCFENIARFVVNNNIDTLVNALGILHQDGHNPEKTITQLQPDWMMENLKVNCFSSLLLLKYLSENLLPDSVLKFVALSARVGSISDNALGGWISYRVSKAALNMGLKTVAIEWKYKFKKAIIAAYHPGTVDTKLSKPFQANAKTLLTPEQASAHLYSFLESLTTEMSGGFYSWQKESIPF